MFVGELEFGDLPIETPVGYLFFLAFIFLIVVVMMNLLNGLVSVLISSPFFYRRIHLLGEYERCIFSDLIDLFLTQNWNINCSKKISIKLVSKLQ